MYSRAAWAPGTARAVSVAVARSPMHMTCGTYFLPDGYESVVVTTITVLPLQSVVRAWNLHALHTYALKQCYQPTSMRRTEQPVKEGHYMEGETECSTLSPLPLLVTTKVTLTATLCCPLTKRCRCKITCFINIFESSTDDESTLKKLIGEAVRGCALCANYSGTLGSSRVSSAEQPTTTSSTFAYPSHRNQIFGFHLCAMFGCVM